MNAKCDIGAPADPTLTDGVPPSQAPTRPPASLVHGIDTAPAAASATAVVKTGKPLTTESIDKVRNERDRLRSLVSQLREKKAPAVSAAGAPSHVMRKLDEARSHNQALASQLEEALADVIRRRTEIRRLQLALKELRGEKKTLRHDGLIAARDLRHVTQRLERRDRDLDKLRKSLKRTRETLTATRGLARDRLNDVKQLRVKHKAAMAALAERYREQLREARRQALRATRQVGALEAKLAAALAARAATRDEARATLAEARRQRNQHEIELNRRDRLLQSAELRGQRLTAQIETLHVQARRAADRLAAAQAGTARVSTRLDTSLKDIGRLRATVKQTRAERDTARAALAEARASARSSGNDLLPQLIARGTSMVDACVRHVRTQLAERARVDARAFAHALMDDEVTVEIGTLCSGIYAHADGFQPLARHLFAKVRPAWVSRHAPAEWIDSLLAGDLDAGRAAFADWLAALPAAPDATQATQLACIAQRLVAQRQLDLAMTAVTRLEPLLDLLDDEQRMRSRWLVEQLARWQAARLDAQRHPAGTCDGKIRFGIIDYKMLDYDKASSNIGDHVQTLASLSNVVRFKNVKFTSQEPGLAEWVDNLRTRLNPDYVIDGPEKEVELVLVDRDFSHSRHYAEPVWMIGFGWYMHPNFRDYFDFPFAPNLRPIFVSFHVNNRAFLTPEAIDYLKANGPIGCRDWTTVYLLREHGIEAFFSGCMTTTVGKVFPRRTTTSERQHVALVDYRPQPGEFEGKEVSKFTQAGTDVRHNSFCRNMDDAVKLLEGYQSYEVIATSRLHCYLPTTALGMDVVFKPRSMSDIRFEGLVELGEHGFARIRDGIEAKLARVLEAAFSGASEAEVRKVWRDACAPDLAFADEYCKRDIDLGLASFDPAALAAQLREGALHGGRAARADDIQVAFAVDHNLGEELPVVLESALANASAPLHVHVMTRGLDRGYWERLIAEFGDRASLSFYNFDVVDYGDQLRMLVHTTVSTMDRLMLPDLLPEIGKVIYLDVDILVLGDLAELWAVELGNAPIAGKSSTFASWRYGYNMAYRAAGTLSHRKAWQLRRAMHAKGPLVFQAFNAGVVVLNLARMRADDFARHYVPLIERYGMNDQDALNVYARGERVHLGIEWNAVPSQDVTDDARILHYAGPVKPWNELSITRGREFNDYKARYLARTGRKA
ncbi:glycosyltransferase family 8 protein [Derxia gummosa]|uniref:Glycosyltransferase family 8 protein n=1 Tax=Derxia gummosa DSM 723 TaxID=1121388 RepID=A0A8B6X1R7_9BURK|nr:glycosyltransferase family 8 protein [Derxia gummosa]